MLEEQFRSDKRIKGGILDKCKLCGEEKTLKLSHIIPRWMYGPLKAESEKGTFHGVYPSINVDNIIHQDGQKQYLLCGECEQLLGDAENYVKYLMNHENVEINAELIQRFIAGIAYKAHFATAAPFHNIFIKKKYLEYIKESLLNKQFREREFFITAIKFYPDKGINPDGLIFVEGITYSKKTFVFTLLAGGWEWFLLINKNNKFNDCPAIKYLNPHKLKNGNDFHIMIGDITEHRFLSRIKIT